MPNPDIPMLLPSTVGLLLDLFSLEGDVSVLQGIATQKIVLFKPEEVFIKLYSEEESGL
jgi:hypothetical protein